MKPGILDIIIAIIMGFALLIQFMKLINVLFKPGFLRSTFFQYQPDKFQICLYILCTMLVLLMSIMSALGYIGVC